MEVTLPPCFLLQVKSKWRACKDHIKTLDTKGLFLYNLKKTSNMIIGFNCSSFDLFHAGHVTMLKMEKQLCDYLIVGLQVDPTIDRPGIKNKPTQSVYERYVQVHGCKYVDEILVYETEADLLNMIKTQTINIRFLSEEYLDRDFTGKQYCIDNGIKLHYHKRRHQYSSTELRNRVYELESQKKKEPPIKNPIKPHSPKLLEKYMPNYPMDMQ